MRHQRHETHFSVLRRGWPQRLSLIDRAPVSPKQQEFKLSVLDTELHVGGEGSGVWEGGGGKDSERREESGEGRQKIG